MTGDKKYFGMSVRQLGILAGLGGLALLLFCIIDLLVISRALRGFTPQKLPATATMQPTPTLIMTPTQTSIPGPTAAPYETLIPANWVQYRTALYEIWLPGGYKPAKAEALILGLGGTPILDLSLRGSYTSKSPNKIYVTVSYEPLTGDSFDTFLTKRLTDMGPYLSPSERAKVSINSVPATRLVFSGRSGNTDINELTYVIQDGTTIWYVQYTAEINEFYELLQTFENSANTFRVAK